MAAAHGNAYLGSRGRDGPRRRGGRRRYGRITDAALVVGPAAWWHGWGAGLDPTNLDAIAGAIVAGHVIECGRAGGNYAFFTDVPGLEHPGFPIAEVAFDGTSP